MLQTCDDFANEPSILQTLIQERGHICRFCVKCHPELAGAGVEYCWGMSKKGFRRNNAKIGPSACNAKNLRGRVTTALRLVEKNNVLAFARKTRRYRNAYMQTDEELDSFESIEKFVKKHKCHRNILDQETHFLEDQLVSPASDGSVIL